LQSTLFINITVWDQDDGYSADDFVGNYKFFVTPQMMNRFAGGAFAPWIDHVITIPFHSEIVLRYRAACIDAECQNQPTGPQLFDNNNQINQFVRNPFPQEQLIGSQGQWNPWSTWNQWGNWNQGGNLNQWTNWIQFGNDPFNQFGSQSIGSFGSQSFGSLGSFGPQSFGQSSSGSFNRFPFDRQRTGQLEASDSKKKAN